LKKGRRGTASALGLGLISLGLLGVTAVPQPGMAQTAPTFTITDKTGLNSTNSNGMKLFYGLNHGDHKDWTQLPFGTSTEPINLPMGVGDAGGGPGGILQVILASPTGISTGQGPGTVMIGPGYSQLYEFSTVGQGPYTFDISQVNNFSFPSTVTAPSLNNLGNPSNLTREEIFTQYKTYAKEKGLGYDNLIIGNTPAPSDFSTTLGFPFTLPPGVVPTTSSQSYQAILNPGQAVVPGAINLIGNSAAADIKTSTLDTAWDDFLTRVEGQGSFSLYSPAYGGISGATITGTVNDGVKTVIPPASIFGAKAIPNKYDSTSELHHNILYYNAGANFSGLQFTAPSQITSNNGKIYVPTPSDITVQLLWKDNQPTHNIISNTGTKYKTTMTVSAADAQKLHRGMFLVNANNYFTNLGKNGTTSDVRITEIVSDGNKTSTLTLESPGGHLQTTPPTNNNNSVVLFSNINDRTQAHAPAAVWLANMWPLDSNQNFDNEVYCGTSAGCDASKWVGQIKTQINQAVNWGSLAAPLPASSNTVINTVWGNPANWYNTYDDNDNPTYNVYSAFWHTQGVAIPFGSNTSPYDKTFGAAYGFSVDENPYPYPSASGVQVPSKWDSTLPQGTDFTITLQPWSGSTPHPEPCDVDNTVCWQGGSGAFATAGSWAAGEPPSSATPSLISFQPAYATEGGTANNNISSLSALGIEYASGAGSYTITDQAITLMGFNGFAISHEAGNQQTISAPLILNGSSRLSLNVTEDSSLTLSGGLEAASGWRKSGSGLLSLNGIAKGTASTGSIAVAGGTLALLNNTDLSNYAGISSAPLTLIEGSGTLPGTSGKGIQGVLVPGTDTAPVGQLTFKGDLTFGSGGAAVLHNLSTTPATSDLIEATGSLTINQIGTALSVGSVSSSENSYYIPLISVGDNQSVSGEFTKIIGLTGDQTVHYRSTGISRGVFLQGGTGPGPGPGDCIHPGDPATSTAPYATSFCGGRLVVNSTSETENWLLENTSRANRIDLAGFASTTNFSGVFSGAGDLSFENTGGNNGGVINVSGQNTYTGPTTIGDGTRVSVNSTIATSSSLLVNPGGTVGGNGQLPSTTLNTGATIAPGNSIGTLTAAALDLNGGTIAAEIQGPQNDRINVSGDVTNFTGTAALLPFGGGSPFPGFVYTVVDAPASAPFATSSSLTLDQSQVSSALLRFGTTLVQNPQNNAQAFAVQWQPNSSAGATTAAIQALGGGSSNNLCMANSLDRAFNSLVGAATNNVNNSGSAIGSTGFTTGQASAAGMSAGFVEALNNLVLLPSGNQLLAAVNSLSAQPYAAFLTVGLETLKQQRESVLAQAGQCLNNGWWIVNGKKAKKPLCAFALAQNSTSSIRGNSNLSAYNGGVFSTGFGLEYYPSQQWSVGANYGYGSSYANNFATTSASVSAAVNSVNLFSQFRASEQWRVRGLLGYSVFNGSASRSIASIGNGSSLTSTPNGNGLTAALETDYAIPLTRASSPTQAMIKPLLGLAWGSYQQSAFSESGNALALSVSNTKANSFVTTAGMEFTTSPIPLSRSSNVTLRPSLLVAYQVDALANNISNKSVNATFTQAPTVCGSCNSEAQNLGTNAINLTGGVELQLSQSTALYLNASYNAYTNASQFGYGGGVRVRL